MKWKLFANLAEITGEKQVDVDAGDVATVGDALDALIADYPALEDQVFDEDGAVQDHINVLRNGTNVFLDDGLDTELDESDELALFPPVSGG